MIPLVFTMNWGGFNDLPFLMVWGKMCIMDSVAASPFPLSDCEVAVDM